MTLCFQTREHFEHEEATEAKAFGCERKWSCDRHWHFCGCTTTHYRREGRDWKGGQMNNEMNEMQNLKRKDELNNFEFITFFRSLFTRAVMIND